MQIHLNQIVVLDKNPVQVIDFYKEQGVCVVDVHSKIELTHRSLLSSASKDEVKWFCENNEHIEFKQPPSSQAVR